VNKQDEVVFSTEDILAITPGTINELKQRAKKSPRKRYRLCMHHDHSDSTQEMLIACCNDTYMPPHRHPLNKTESYHVVEGSMVVYFFDDEGTVIRRLAMGEYSSGDACLYRLSKPVWHMPVPTSEWLIYHECYTGPFDKDIDVTYPDWAPDEVDKKAVTEFLQRVCVYG